MVTRAGRTVARDPRWPGYDQATSGPAPPLEVSTPGGAPPRSPGEHPQGPDGGVPLAAHEGITGRSGLVCRTS